MAAALADELRHGKVLTVPNLLSTLRIAMTPYIGHLVLHGSYPLAMTWFVVAGATDLVWLRSRLGAVVWPTLMLALVCRRTAPLQGDSHCSARWSGLR